MGVAGEFARDDIPRAGVSDAIVKLKELEKRLKQEPLNLGLRVQVAGMMREAGRSIEAVELYRSVAFAYRDQGRTQQAVAVCRSVLEIAPDDSVCQGLLNQLLNRSSPTLPPPVSPAAPLVAKAPPAPSRPSTPPPIRETEREIPERNQHPRVITTAPITIGSMPSIKTQEEPIRRSSQDETPLPKPMPYHEFDRTSQPSKLSAREIEERSTPHLQKYGADERTTQTTGLAQAARHISGLFSAPTGSSPGIPNREMDLSAELDTRQRPRVAAEEIRKLERGDAPIPPTHLDDLVTPVPSGDDDTTDQVDALTPPPRASEDALTPPPLHGAVPVLGRRPPPPLPVPRSPGQRLTIPAKRMQPRDEASRIRHSRDSEEMTVPQMKYDDEEDDEDTDV